MNFSSRQDKIDVFGDPSIEVKNRQKFPHYPIALNARSAKTCIPSNQYLGQNHEQPRQWMSSYYEPRALGEAGVQKQWQITTSKPSRKCHLKDCVDLRELRSEATSDVMRKLSRKVSSDSYLHQCAAIITNTVNKTIDKAYAEAMYEKQREDSEQRVRFMRKPESETVLSREACNCKVTRPRQRLTQCSHKTYRPFNEMQSGRQCKHSRIPISLKYMSYRPYKAKNIPVSWPVQATRKRTPIKLTRATQTFAENKKLHEKLHVTPLLSNKFVQTSVEKCSYHDAIKLDSDSGKNVILPKSKEIGLPRPVSEKLGLMSRNVNTDLPLEHCMKAECEKANCTSKSESVNKDEHTNTLGETITDKMLKTNSNYMLSHHNRSVKIDLTDKLLDQSGEPIQIELNLKLRDPVERPVPQKEIVAEKISNTLHQNRLPERILFNKDWSRKVTDVHPSGKDCNLGIEESRPTFDGNRRDKAVVKTEDSVTESLPRYRRSTECTRQRYKDKAMDHKKRNRERRSPRYLMMAQTRVQTPSNVIWAATVRNKKRLQRKKQLESSGQLGNELNFSTFSKQSGKNPGRVDVTDEDQSRTANETLHRVAALNCSMPPARTEEILHANTMQSRQTQCSDHNWFRSSSFASKPKELCSRDLKLVAPSSHTVVAVKEHPKVGLSVRKYEPCANSSLCNNLKRNKCTMSLRKLDDLRHGRVQISECDRLNFTLKDYAVLNVNYNRLLENLSGRDSTKLNGNYHCSRTDLGRRLQKSLVAGTTINLSKSCSTTHKMKTTFPTTL